MLRKKSLQSVIDRMETGVSITGVLEDTYMSQTKPEWVVLETEDEALQVEQLLKKARNRKDPDSHAAWIHLKQIVGDCLSDHLNWVFRSGNWLVSPDELLMEFEAWEEEEDFELLSPDNKEEEPDWGEFVGAQSARIQEEADSYIEEDTPEEEEDEEGPWGWSLTEYNNAKFGEEG